ncbi:D-alanine--D-alanine ligase, partial [Candidatus Peregrinibacteria bacterium]|nr:D-alanine--D-alanine ligase [Candidatus Peregrinibacteria bacterium]
SLVSATSVIKALDPEKYEVQQIGITPGGLWCTGSDCLEKFKNADYERLDRVLLSTDINDAGRPDIIFPVLHGPFGEDGTIQGLFEMLQLPYVGCGVLASSTAMDKLQCKALWKAAGLPVVPWKGFLRKGWEEDKNKILQNIIEDIGFPCFIKPSNMGSSVGISKVKKEEDLEAAINLAARFDRLILAEKGLNVREIECAVLGNDDPIASPAGEVIVGGEFYDFHDKYVNGVSMTEVPAQLEPKVADEIREICVKAYKLLDCAGLARVDCFIDKDSGEIYLNEINTMPGFTSISMYPKMMEAHGMSYPELVDELIRLGIERFEDKQKNQVVFDSKSDWFKE